LISASSFFDCIIIFPERGLFFTALLFSHYIYKISKKVPCVKKY
jgi:hypothetical protein